MTKLQTCSTCEYNDSEATEDIIYWCSDCIHRSDAENNYTPDEATLFNIKAEELATPSNSPTPSTLNLTQVIEYLISTGIETEPMTQIINRLEDINQLQPIRIIDTPDSMEDLEQRLANISNPQERIIATTHTYMMYNLFIKELKG